MTSHPHFTRPDPAATRALTGRPPHGTLPGAITYGVLAVWAGVAVTAAITGVFAGDGASRLALPASVAVPLAAVAVLYRAWPRFRNSLLSLDLRLVLAAQLWRVVGTAFLIVMAFGQLPAGFAVPAGAGDIATGVAALGVVLALGHGSLTRGRLYAFTALGVGDFLVAFATGLTLGPPALTAWPLAIYPTLLVPFFAVLHLVAVLQSRHDWEARAGRYAIRGQDPEPALSPVSAEPLALGDSPAVPGPGAR